MFVGSLKPYQEEGIETFLRRKNLLCAWEMGLGKTILGIAAAEELFDTGAISCCLIVCPASLKYQWAQRIAQFTDDVTYEWKDLTLSMMTCVIDGTPTTRAKLYEHVVPKVKYVIMGYDNVINDASFVSKIKPGMVIIDEATAIKTFKAKRTKQIKKMLRAPYRMALTGTPVENRPDELFSIMQWVDDKVLGRYDLFDKAYCKRNHFGWITGYKNLSVLRNRISPAMSRKSRLDLDVRPYLPEVDYSEDWTTEISKPVKELYKIIAKDIIMEMKNIDPRKLNLNDFYSGKDESSAQGKIMAMVMCLEMLLDHPDLVILSAQNGAKYANYLWQEGYLDSILESAKLDLLLKKTREILQFQENKIVIFSFYREMLNILEEELDVKTVQFHGDLSAAEKSAAIGIFTNDMDCRVLLSSHAGAYGADLFMANYLINFDQPWSSGRADQINGRHVRVSSEFQQVFVRDILASDSVDEWKKRKVIRKRKIAEAILDGQNKEVQGEIQMDGDTLKDHLLWVLKNW